MNSERLGTTVAWIKIRMKEGFNASCAVQFHVCSDELLDHEHPRFVLLLFSCRKLLICHDCANGNVIAL